MLPIRRPSTSEARSKTAGWHASAGAVATLRLSLMQQQYLDHCGGKNYNDQTENGDKGNHGHKEQRTPEKKQEGPKQQEKGRDF